MTLQKKMAQVCPKRFDNLKRNNIDYSISWKILSSSHHLIGIRSASYVSKFQNYEYERFSCQFKWWESFFLADSFSSPVFTTLFLLYSYIVLYSYSIILSAFKTYVYVSVYMCVFFMYVYNAFGFSCLDMVWIVINVYHYQRDSDTSNILQKYV